MWFPPEQAPIGHIFLTLAQKAVGVGHSVLVVTGFPNHPTGRLFPGYRRRLWQREEIDGVEILRVVHWIPRSRSVLSRLAGFLTFTLAASVALLLSRKIGLVVAVLQPLSVGPILSFICRVKRAKLLLNIQDLHPDAAIEAGLIKSPSLIAISRWIESYSYRKADALAVICPAFKEHCRKVGAVAAGAVTVIPNFIQRGLVEVSDCGDEFRTRLGVGRDDFMVLYAGTIGFASGVSIVIDAASILCKSSPQVRVVFVGEGPSVVALKESVATLKLTNVLFHGFVPTAELSAMQASPNLSLVTLASGRGRYSVPSKVLAYMSAERPVLAAVDGDSETARLVRESGCGVVCEPEGAALAAAIERIANMPIETRASMAKQGREYLLTSLSEELVTAQYVALFDRLLRGK